MLTVGDAFPGFELMAVVSNDLDKGFVTISNNTFKGKWLVLFSWPKDFTFVCPTELVAFCDLNNDFLDRDAQLLGLSIDSEFVHHAWRKYNAQLHQLSYPMLSDVKRELCAQLGILDKNAGVAQRATFIIDPHGIIRFSMVTDLNVGRNPVEVLRVLDALQTGSLCPCNWQRGDSTL
jgi:alkyl hydroperoxide reductase subunit AhpC